MANEQNIKPYEFTSDQSREAAAENGRKGGLACAAARRERKTMREFAELFAGKEITVPGPNGQKIDTTFAGAVVFAQYQKAIKEGNTKAAQFLADLQGELVQRVSVDAPLVVLPENEAATISKLKK